MRNVLVIGGLDPTGGAGISMDVRILTTLGLHSFTVATCIVPQTARRVLGLHPIPPEVLREEITAALETSAVHACKIGLLGSQEAVRLVSEVLASVRAEGNVFPVVLDPVLRASLGRDLAGSALLPHISELCEVCDVITPNVKEARRLAGTSTRSTAVLGKRLAGMLGRSGMRTAVITDGAHATDRVFWWEGSSFRSAVLKGEHVPGEFHGTGCIHSSTVAALLARGYDVLAACGLARSFMGSVLRESVPAEGGSRGLTLPQVHASEMRYRYVTEVYGAAMRLCRLIPREHLPQVGTNIAYALPFPKGLGDVCALTSRIVRWEDTLRTFGRAEFGVESHMARLAFALARRHYALRSCANLKASPDLITAAKRARLKCIEVNRRSEPEDAPSTMDWLAARVGGGVAVIFDSGMKGKEAMLRVVAPTPARVVESIENIMKEL